MTTFDDVDCRCSKGQIAIACYLHNGELQIAKVGLRGRKRMRMKVEENSLQRKQRGGKGVMEHDVVRKGRSTMANPSIFRILYVSRREQ